MDNNTTTPATVIGFKRVMNKKYPLSRGYERKFVKCKKCRIMAYYDFVPYSLSNPVMAASCGHDIRRDYKEI